MITEPTNHVDLKEMYRQMLRIRRYEERIGDLVETKQVSTPCHLYIGQEAIAVGACAALESRDTVWGGHRSHGHYLAKGGDALSMIAEIMGKAGGCSGARGGSMHLLAKGIGVLGTVPLVAATIPLAVGAGLTAKIRGSGEVAVSFFGDGATEEGHFHESVNLAALYKLPVIFLCENNFYASHMALHERRAADNIVKSAEVHGVPGVRVDGNDVEAVFHASNAAVALARSGGGPTLVEARTYRWRGHVGPDPNYDVGVKRRDELKDWIPKDPIARARRILVERGRNEAELDSIVSDVEAEVNQAIKAASAMPEPGVEGLLDHVYAEEGV
ncbi:MAG: hypothetical protein COX66_18180 [Elusimicrobia bacterium CG_4_10_14_0_2_um_filter_63_34]|nr:MAG: hypothetical protein COX66_18180 [Elusimicrobia bacterium CG_4_10_14_0_2_um_filter_63_34]